MVIRKQQMDAFEDEMLARFMARMATHPRVTFPQELASLGLLTDEDVLDLIRRGLEAAQQYGVTNEGDVERYVECMVILGPQFDSEERFPWAKEILDRQNIDGESKMDRIDEYLIFGSIKGSTKGSTKDR